MEIITRLFSSALNIISSIFFLACVTVMAGFVWKYVSASTNKLWMSSPQTYNVHTVDIRSEGRWNNTTCWLIEKGDKQFYAAPENNAGKNCDVPLHILKNWEDHGQNYRRLGFKFWASSLVLFVFGSFVFCWLPGRVIGFNGAGVIVCAVCIGMFGMFTAFFVAQDVRAAYAPPKSWYVKEGGKIYSADVRFYLQDKHGTVYTWSSGGTADATRVPDLGKPSNNYTK